MGRFLDPKGKPCPPQHSAICYCLINTDITPCCSPSLPASRSHVAQESPGVQVPLTHLPEGTAQLQGSLRNSFILGWLIDTREQTIDNEGIHNLKKVQPNKKWSRICLGKDHSPMKTSQQKDRKTCRLTTITTNCFNIHSQTGKSAQEETQDRITDQFHQD